MSEYRCPSRDELLAYRCGELAEVDGSRVSEHLGACSACQATLDNLGPDDDTFAARLRRSAEPGPYDIEPERGQVVQRLKAMAIEPTIDSQAKPDVSPRREVWCGKQLGEYELLELLGQGGMGAVYKAVHTRLKRTVAVKVLPKERMADERTLVRFNREMEAVGRLSHTNIVQAHDAREIDGTHFLVMEYIQGRDLSELVRQLGPLPIADACEMVRQAAIGLQYAHDNGLIHRDIKPSNLMLASPPPAQAGEGPGEGVQPIIKILDMGLARLTEEPNADSQMTQAGQVMGTADYIAPEQVLDCRSADAAADQYSLSCTLYKLLTGHAPFGDSKAKRPFETMMAHVQQPVPSITAFRADAPCELVTLIERMLAKKPEQRFVNMAAVAAALEPFTTNCDLARLAASADGQEGGVTPAVRSLANTDDYRSSAMVGTTSSMQIKPQPKPLPKRFRWTPKAIALAVVSAFLLLFGGIVIWIDGTRLDVPDNSDIRITKDGEVHIETLRADQSAPSAPAAKSGASPPVSDDVDLNAEREVAEWLLEQSFSIGFFYVKSLDGETVWRSDDLPDEPFTVSRVDLNRTRMSDEDLQSISEQLPRLRRLEDFKFSFHRQLGAQVLYWLSNVKHLERLTLICGINDADIEKLVSRGPVALKKLHLNHTPITDVSLERLSTLSSLEDLSVKGAPVTDAGVRHLTKLPNLRSIDLCGTKTTGKAIAYLSQCDTIESLQAGQLVLMEELRVLKEFPNLKELSLHDIMTDEGMRHLRDLSQLTYLAMRGKTVTDAGLANIRGMKQLKHLDVTANAITDAGLRHFEDAAQLEFLNLAGTKISNAGLEHIANHQRILQIIDLTDTQIDDGALIHLARMKGLWHTTLAGTKVTAQGLANHNDAIWHCGIHCDPEIKTEWDRLVKAQAAAPTDQKVRGNAAGSSGTAE